MPAITVDDPTGLDRVPAVPRGRGSAASEG